MERISELNFKRVLITGGAGFIGSHIAEALVAAGCEVRVIDNLASGYLENLAHLGDRVTFIKGDIRDAGAVGADGGRLRRDLSRGGRRFRDPDRGGAGRDGGGQ